MNLQQTEEKIKLRMLAAKFHCDVGNVTTLYEAKGKDLEATAAELHKLDVAVTRIVADQRSAITQ